MDGIEQLLFFLDDLDLELPRFERVGPDPDRLLRDEYSPHVHEGWELKYTPGKLLILVCPGVPHEVSGICPISFELCPDRFSLVALRRVLFLDRPLAGTANLLPELFELLMKTPDDAVELRTRLLRAMLAALRLLAETAVPTAGAAPDPCRPALDFMMRHYFRRELSVGEIAEFAGVSPQYLNRLFRSRFGSGVRQRLIAIRLDRARELLESGQYLVGDAARLTGWSCPFYFCNSFRKRYGASPVHFRRAELKP